MEMYFDPSESAAVERDAVLRGFAAASLGASAQPEGDFWDFLRTRGHGLGSGRGKHWLAEYP
jgi:hypothetical protein